MEALARYHAAVTFLESLSNIHLANQYMKGGAPDPGIYLERVQWLLDSVGNPEKNSKFIHVAGTAGKGTVAALVQDMLVRSGKKTGLFTSPFASTSVEKIKIDSAYIDPDIFADLVEEIKPILNSSLTESLHGMPSYFEIFFVLALMSFRQAGCEWAVLEVGLGGTYDATNVIPSPEIGIITTIDYDHMQLLGRSLPEIASNKAGIIKRGSQIWTSEQRPELRELFRHTCEARGALYHDVVFEGTYQLRNEAVAGAVADYLSIERDIQRQAVENFRLPCRFEKVQDSPQVILDGAHNPVKVRAAVDRLKMLQYDKLRLVIGMAEDKDAEAMVQEIMPLADSVYYTRFLQIQREALSPLEIKEKAGKEGEVFLDPYQALERALHHATENDLVLVIGSFYLAGELRKRWYPEAWVVTNRRSF